MLDDGRVERELVVRDRMTVGRDPTCDVSDADPRLSRRHAEFVLTPGGLLVRDLDSRNGIRVNGRSVREAVLAPGDLVEVAHLGIRFMDDGMPSGIFEPAGQAFPPAPPRPAEGVQVKEGFEDDRTRVVQAPVLSTTPSGPMGDPPDPPPPLMQFPGDVTVRVPRPHQARLPIRLGVRDLFASRWGWRVLAQGVLLAGVVFLISVVPMLNWFSGVTGPVPTALIARMLAAPLLASLVAGLMVASLIARTTARALDRDDESQA